LGDSDATVASKLLEGKLLPLCKFNELGKTLDECDATVASKLLGAKFDKIGETLDDCDAAVASKLLEGKFMPLAEFDKLGKTLDECDATVASKLLGAKFDKIGETLDDCDATVASKLLEGKFLPLCKFGKIGETVNLCDATGASKLFIVCLPANVDNGGRGVTMGNADNGCWDLPIGMLDGTGEILGDCETSVCAANDFPVLLALDFPSNS